MHEVVPDDLELLTLIRQDDAHAFEQLYNRYWRLLWQLAAKKTGDASGARDLVQELFLDIWKRRASLELKGTFRTYLIAALFLKIFKHFRKQGFQASHYQDFENYLVQTGQDAEQVYHRIQQEEMELGKMSAILEAAIEQMPQQMKKIVTLKYFKQYSNSEIAEELGISVNTVKNHLKAATIRLRRTSESSSLILLLYFMNNSSY